MPRTTFPARRRCRSGARQWRLPAAGDWTLAVEPGRSELVERATRLPAVPVPQAVDPGPLGWSAAGDGVDAVAVVDRPDPAIYEVNGFYPSAIVQAGAVQWQRGRRLLPLRVFPFQYDPVAGTLRYYPDISVTVRVQGTGGSPAARDSSQESGDRNQGTGVRGQGAGDSASIGSNGFSRSGAPATEVATTNAGAGALRIRTGGRGMVRLTYDALVSAGVPVTTTDPATFAVSYLGQLADIRLIQATPGPFASGDSVVFYAEPYQGRYQTDNVYWFTYGGTGSATDGDAYHHAHLYRAGGDRDHPDAARRVRPALHEHHRPAEGRGSLVRHGDRPPLCAHLLHAEPERHRARRRAHLARPGQQRHRARATNDRSIGLRLNDHDAGTFAWTGLTDTLAITTTPASWLAPISNTLGLWPGTGLVYPDWVEVTYPSQARAYSDTLYIEGLAPGANEVVVAGFSAPDAVVYDLRDPLHPVLIAATSAEPVSPTYTLHFWDADLPGPTYFLATDAGLAAPLAIEPVAHDSTPSPLLSPANHADYIAIVHRSLWDAIDPLLVHRHDDDGFTVAKVDVQQIYDEFSYGRRDPEAIRSFLTYAYQNWKGPDHDAAAPQYVVLVGSGTYDFTGVGGGTKPNLVPPYLVDVDPWIGETAADNRFVSVDPRWAASRTSCRRWPSAASRPKPRLT